MNITLRRLLLALSLLLLLAPTSRAQQSRFLTGFTSMSFSNGTKSVNHLYANFANQIDAYVFDWQGRHPSFELDGYARQSFKLGGFSLTPGITSVWEEKHHPALGPTCILSNRSGNLRTIGFFYTQFELENGRRTISIPSLRSMYSFSKSASAGIETTYFQQDGSSIGRLGPTVQYSPRPGVSLRASYLHQAWGTNKPQLRLFIAITP